MANKYKQKPDEHPRPHIDVPMSIFGELPFCSDYAMVGRVVHAWCHAVWKKNPYLIAGLEWSKDPEDMRRLQTFGWIVVRGKRARWTGPKKDKRWLLDDSAPKTWWTYAIEAVGTDRVKIGRSLQVGRRLEELQVASAHQLRLIASREGDLEDELHKLLRPHWVGGEWFLLNDESAAVIRQRLEVGG